MDGTASRPSSRRQSSAYLHSHALRAHAARTDYHGLRREFVGSTKRCTVRTYRALSAHAGWASCKMGSIARVAERVGLVSQVRASGARTADAGNEYPGLCLAWKAPHGAYHRATQTHGVVSYRAG